MPRLHWLHGPRSQIFFATTAVTLTIVVSLAYSQWASYIGTIADAERDTRNAATLVADHTALTFEAVTGRLSAVARVHSAATAGLVPSDRASLHRILKGIHGGGTALCRH